MSIGHRHFLASFREGHTADAKDAHLQDRRHAALPAAPPCHTAIFALRAAQGGRRRLYGFIGVGGQRSLSPYRINLLRDFAEERSSMTST